jgi:hypothetical protein
MYRGFRRGLRLLRVPPAAGVETSVVDGKANLSVMSLKGSSFEGSIYIP